jgi:hypothetical protein
MSDRFKFEESQKGKKGDPSLFEEASWGSRQVLISFSILNLSIGQAVLLRGILIAAWMKPSA